MHSFIHSVVNSELSGRTIAVTCVPAGRFENIDKAAVIDLSTILINCTQFLFYFISFGPSWLAYPG